MSGDRLAAFLRRHKRIGLDTSIFIYHVEASTTYGNCVASIFSWLEGPGAQAVTSTVTMVELLVHPYRAADLDRVNQFYALLSTYPHLEWIPPTLPLADQAARLRATHGLKAPDAIQAATALGANALGFISNDPAFKRVRDLDVLLVDDLLP